MKNVQLLLVENVSNLGIVGDVVKVKPGYARNYLLPRGLAEIPTEGAKQRVEERRKQVQEELRRQREALERTMQALDDTEHTVERAANDQGILYGSVTQHDVAQLLRDQGHAIEDRAVRIGEQIKQQDRYTIPIEQDDFKARIKLWVVSDEPAGEAEDEEEEAEEEALEAE